MTAEDTLPTASTLRDGAQFQYAGLPCRLIRRTGLGPEGGKIRGWDIWTGDRRIVEWAPDRESALRSLERTVEYFGAKIFKTP